MWEQCKGTVDKTLQDVQPLQKIEQNPWFPFKPEHHFRKIMYSIVIVFHTMWVVKGFYRMLSLFTVDVSHFAIHEVAVVFFCRLIGFLLQLCGILYFIQRLLGRASTALVESITKNYSYVQLFNAAASAPFLLIGVGANLVNYNQSALCARFMQFCGLLACSVVHLLVCDIFLTWPDDASPGSGGSGGSGAAPALPNIDKMPKMEDARNAMKEGMARAKQL